MASITPAVFNSEIEMKKRSLNVKIFGSDLRSLKSLTELICFEKKREYTLQYMLETEMEITKLNNLMIFKVDEDLVNKNGLVQEIENDMVSLIDISQNNAQWLMLILKLHEKDFHAFVEESWKSSRMKDKLIKEWNDASFNKEQSIDLSKEIISKVYDLFANFISKFYNKQMKLDTDIRCKLMYGSQFKGNNGIFDETIEENQYSKTLKFMMEDGNDEDCLNIVTKNLKHSILPTNEDNKVIEEEEEDIPDPHQLRRRKVDSASSTHFSVTLLSF
mmetsp:Transcript_53769/g.69058  ORF Transcript_53769/g.69058 Transcript_53769/m.69058 type:complete len:275 (+) Transcript_53769:132-956(+)